MAGPLKGQSIFKKVGLSEKKSLFRELARSKLLLFLKGEGDVMFHLMAIQCEKDESLFCRHTADSTHIKTSQKVIVNFSYESERFFMHTEIRFEGAWIIMPIKEDLFHLQRRASARIEIPDVYDGSFMLLTHNGLPFFTECLLRDISAGGLKIQLPGDEPTLKSGDLINGRLRLGARRPMPFDAEIRFAQKVQLPQGRGVAQVAGIRFLNVDNILENRLLSLIMDVQREIFLKHPNR